MTLFNSASSYTITGEEIATLLTAIDNCDALFKQVDGAGAEETYFKEERTVLEKVLRRKQ